MGHIIIIGAGAAGLMAACELAGKGHQVTIVEARDRIGGRVNTLAHEFSIPMEAGAEFVHGEKPLTMSLIIESGNKVSLLEGKRFQLWDGELQTGDLMDDSWGQLLSALKDLKKDTDMNSFLQEYFGEEKYTGLRQHVKGFVEGYDAADLNKVSAFALREEWENTDDEHQYHLQGGYVTLMNYLRDKAVSAGSKLLLSSPVKEITWSERNVKVNLETGELLEGDRVIVTVPLGVLQKGSIKFTPALLEHKKAFSGMGFGGIIKFLLEFKTPFWETKGKHVFNDMAFIFSDADVPTWWSQLPDKTPVLTGWFGGPDTFTQVHNNDYLLQKSLQSLSYIFDRPVDEIREQLKTYHIADWTQDPFSYGAYAYETLLSAQARRVLTDPVMNTIYFAGEAIYHGPHMGTVEAALISGREVGKSIADGQ